MEGSTNPIESLTACERVLLAVAEATDTPQTELSPPLYEVVDPDAMEALVDGSPGSSVELSFAYHGCSVTVYGNGDVSVASEGETPQSVTVLSAEDCPKETVSTT